MNQKGNMLFWFILFFGFILLTFMLMGLAGNPSGVPYNILFFEGAIPTVWFAVAILILALIMQFNVALLGVAIGLAVHYYWITGVL